MNIIKHKNVQYKTIEIQPTNPFIRHQHQKKQKNSSSSNNKKKNPTFNRISSCDCLFGLDVEKIGMFSNLIVLLHWLSV
jgi:hypothetical protein